MLTEDEVGVITGPTITPNFLAMIDTAAEAEMPMILITTSACIVEVHPGSGGKKQ